MNNYTITILATISPFLMVWLTTLVLSFNKYSYVRKETLTNDYTLKKAIGRASTWLIATTFWMLAEYLLVIFPFVANSVVIYLSLNAVSNKEYILVFSIISSASIVFGYAINPQRHKKCYRKAYTHLDNEINRYLLTADADLTNQESLVEAIATGEAFIDGSYDIEK